MKKAMIFTVLILILILVFPIYRGSYDDGGTKEFVSPTYRIVDWNRISDSGVYEKTRIYFFEDMNKSIDELWEMEMDSQLIKHEITK